MTKTQSGSTSRGAIDLLTDDHRRVQKLFRELNDLDPGDDEAVRDLVETACVELQIHAMLEEEIFYPALRAHAPEAARELQELLNKSEVEHEVVGDLIANLQELEPDDAMYLAYFSVLCDMVKNHVREEEKELFPAAKQMSGLDLDQLADEMRTRREELFAELENDEGEDEDVDEESEEGEAGETATLEEEDEGFEDEQEQIDITTSRTRH